MADTGIYACQLGDLDGVEVLRDDMLVTSTGDTIEEANADHDANLIELCKELAKLI